MYCYKFIKERLALFDSLIKKGIDLRTGSLWIVEPSQLRFCMGESIRDLKIPYIFGGEDETVIEKSILSLILLLKKRIEPGIDLTIQEGLPSFLDIKTSIIEKTYRADYFLPNSPVKNIAYGILTTTPVVDSGILKAWLDQDGPGKEYYLLVKTILEKAMLEEIRLERIEKTSYLATMAIINTTVKKKEDIIRKIRVKGLNYERLDQIVGLALYHVIRVAAETVASDLRQIMLSYGTVNTEGLFEGYFTLRSFLTVPINVIGSDLNPYGIHKDIVPKMKPLYESALKQAEDTGAIAEMMETHARRDKALLKELEALSSTNHVRHLISGYLLECDVAGVDFHRQLAEMYYDNKLIQALFTDNKALTQLETGLEEIRAKFHRDISRSKRIEELLDYIASVKKTTFGNILGMGKKRDVDITVLIKGFIAYSFDEDVEKFIGSMLKSMVDRRREFSGEMLKLEYERGRLYRFSTDERSILKEIEAEAEGHLFVDMKDFTRKTLRAKEITMADFMESNFYKPILSAAGHYSAATDSLAENKGGIRLNNLLGDAVIFSGGVANLIALAGDIQQIMKRYKEQLARRVPYIIEEELMRSIHKNFEAMKEDIVKEVARIEKTATEGEEDIEERLMKLKEKQLRLEKQYREELEAAVGQEMEAGLFVSFGSKAELIVMRDKVWGEVMVAIGEKINEAARGTYRNSIVRAKMERLLEVERVRRHNPSLCYPFDVYIDKIYGVMMPPHMDDQLKDIFVQRDMSTAKDLSQALESEYYKDLQQIVYGGSLSSTSILTAMSDIYNKGQALSDDALKAYMKQMKGRAFFFKKEVQVADLAEEIQSAFFFPSRVLELWFGAFMAEEAKHIEIFYRAGEITFKGFEAAAPTVVYEIVNKNAPFAKLLFEHHFDGWHEEAQRKAKDQDHSHI